MYNESTANEMYSYEIDENDRIEKPLIKVTYFSGAHIPQKDKHFSELSQTIQDIFNNIDGFDWIQKTQ